MRPSLRGQRSHVLILKTLMSCLPPTTYGVRGTPRALRCICLSGKGAVSPVRAEGNGHVYWVRKYLRICCGFSESSVLRDKSTCNENPAVVKDRPDSNLLPKRCSKAKFETRERERERERERRTGGGTTTRVSPFRKAESSSSASSRY